MDTALLKTPANSYSYANCIRAFHVFIRQDININHWDKRVLYTGIANNVLVGKYRSE